MNETVDNLLKSRENNFDFMRFVAALAVIFSHSFDVAPGEKEPLLNFSHDIFSIGSISVAIFFIISGMLISQSFDRSDSFLTFARARVLRIYPALIVIIILSVFIIGPIFTTLSTSQYFHDLTTFRYLKNMLAIHINYTLPGVFPVNHLPNIFNASLWSLPQEIGCYFLIAVVGFLFTKKYVQAFIIGIIILLVYRQVLFAEHVQNVYYFGLGALIYVFRNKIIINKYAGILSFFAFIANLYFNTNMISAYIITGITLGYFILYSGFIKTTHLKNWSKGGDFSYGLYIWAFPIQQIVYLRFPTFNPYYNFLVSSCLTLVMAYISWHLVEKHALKLKTYLSLRRFSALSIVTDKRTVFNVFTKKTNSNIGI